jgi:hypothetical protein
MCYGCQNSGGVFSQSHRLRRRVYHILFQEGHVLFVPRRSSFKSTVVLGVREGNLYRLRGQPMHVVTSKEQRDR